MMGTVLQKAVHHKPIINRKALSSNNFNKSLLGFLKNLGLRKKPSK